MSERIGTESEQAGEDGWSCPHCEHDTAIEWADTPGLLVCESCGLPVEQTVEIADGATWLTVHLSDPDPDAGGAWRTGTVRSSLHEDGTDADDDPVWHAAVDAVEALVLAHACAGVDVSATAYRTGTLTALEAIGNNLA